MNLFFFFSITGLYLVFQGLLWMVTFRINSLDQISLGVFRRFETPNPGNANTKRKTQTVFLESSSHEPSPSCHPVTLAVQREGRALQEGAAECRGGRRRDAGSEICPRESWLCCVSHTRVALAVELTSLSLIYLAKWPVIVSVPWNDSYISRSSEQKGKLLHWKRAMCWAQSGVCAGASS